MFPSASKHDPERERDEPHVEPKALALRVDAIEAKLVPARNVARRIDLRDTGEAGTDPTALGIAGDIFNCHDLCAAHLELTRPQRARSNEAHIATEDVPELRQLIHRSRTEQPPDAR